MPFIFLAGGLAGGGYWLLLPILFLLVVIPFLDLVTGWQDEAYFEKDDFSAFEIWLLHWNTRLYVLLYMGAVIYIMVNLKNYSPVEIILLVVSAGLLGGIGFAASHELLHAKEKIDQLLQRITTSFLFYPHYKLIHIRSHHLHTSTVHDENTAWLNETVYAYIFRTIPRSMMRCWKLESRRCSDAQPVADSFENKMITYAIGQVVLLLALSLLAGLTGLVFYLAHIVVAHVVLESVNYIQHYGLLRKDEEGVYEKTAAEHSWDTYHYFSSYVTFRVGHHSNHHLAVKPYYSLGTEPDAPKLPVGYFWAIAVVFLPPWWRRVTSPQLKSSWNSVSATENPVGLAQPREVSRQS